MANGKTIDSILNEIKEDIENKVNQAQLNIAEEVAFEIERKYEYAINQFYKDPAFFYNHSDNTRPLYYQRDHNLYAASSGYNGIGESPLGKNLWSIMGGISNRVRKYKDGYIAGIIVNSSLIPGNPYRASTDFVFSRAYERGIHGIYSIDQKRINDQINMYNRGQIFSGWHNIPKKMKTPPKEIMKKEFKKLQKSNYLNEITDKYMSQVFSK